MRYLDSEVTLVQLPFENHVLRMRSTSVTVQAQSGQPSSRLIRDGRECRSNEPCIAPKTMSKLRLGLLILMSIICSVPTTGQEKEVKQPAPYFILPTWDGNTLRSTTLKGKVVVLEFFQTWCPDCQKYSVELEKLYERHKERGLVIVAISHDRDKSVVAPYVKKYSVTYPVLLGDISVALNYIPGITPQAPKFSIPYLVLIDREGNIVGRFQQGREKEASDINLLEERIKKLL